MEERKALGFSPPVESWSAIG